jgi:hypothetical protein
MKHFCNFIKSFEPELCAILIIKSHRFCYQKKINRYAITKNQTCFKEFLQTLNKDFIFCGKNDFLFTKVDFSDQKTFKDFYFLCKILFETATPKELKIFLNESKENKEKKFYTFSYRADLDRLFLID